MLGNKRLNSDNNDNNDSDITHQDKRRRGGDDNDSNITKNDDSSLVLTAAVLEAQVAAQLAAVNAMLNAKNIQSSSSSSSSSISNDVKKTAYKALLLDSQGREIDEKGNLVQHDISQIRSLKANVNIIQKKDNPYLAHRKPTTSKTDNDDTSLFIDPRLSISNKRSEIRAKKSLSFVEEGTYVQQEQEIRAKEERKIVSGYASGRKAIERAHRLNENKTSTDDDNAMDTTIDEAVDDDVEIPPPADGGVVPILEWWDEAYIAKTIREDRKKIKANYSIDDYELLQLSNVKTWKYVQHPVAIKPLGGEKVEVPLPMFLTKKERKRIRKTERAVREQEKRDKQMMGLIPAPEPKFKLSNFMKVLGDQAVADPSKVEMRVVQQMKQRQLNHEMRNQAAKKTPAEKWLKKMKKNQEDTTRQVSVACFWIKDFSHPGHRYKVDVNAQLYYLSGTALMCTEAKAPNLVIVEGGPKGIKRFIKLMTKRIKWHVKAVDRNDNKDQESESESESDDDDDDDNNNNNNNSSNNNSLCQLLWQGCQAKRTFSGFRFQEFDTSILSKKWLESKGTGHYWDLAVNVQTRDDKVFDM